MTLGVLFELPRAHTRLQHSDALPHTAFPPVNFRSVVYTDLQHLRPMILVQKGATGLVVAAQNRHTAVVQLLLEHKADPSAYDQVCH